MRHAHTFRESNSRHRMAVSLPVSMRGCSGSLSARGRPTSNGATAHALHRNALHRRPSGRLARGAGSARPGAGTFGELADPTALSSVLIARSPGQAPSLSNRARAPAPHTRSSVDVLARRVGSLSGIPSNASTGIQLGSGTSGDLTGHGGAGSGDGGASDLTAGHPLNGQQHADAGVRRARTRSWEHGQGQGERSPLAGRSMLSLAGHSAVSHR